MPRNTPGGSPREPLSGLESEVIKAVWKLERASVEQVHDVIGPKRGIKETTTRTILRRLEQKGYIRHEEQGRAYVYTAVEGSRNFAARAVRQIIDRFCQGSVEELVSGMVEAKVISKSDLDALEQLVRKSKERA